MTASARTPDDLDPLLEDATVLGDPAGFRALFDDQALLVDREGREARGQAAIARAFGALRGRHGAYVASGGTVVRNADTALVVADAGTHVLRHTPGACWRVTITFLHPTTERTEP